MKRRNPWAILAVLAARHYPRALAVAVFLTVGFLL